MQGTKLSGRRLWYDEFNLEFHMLKRFMVPMLLLGLATSALAQDGSPASSAGDTNSGAGTSSGSGATDGGAGGSTGTSNGSSGVGGSATDTSTERTDSKKPCTPDKASGATDQKPDNGSARIRTC